MNYDSKIEGEDMTVDGTTEIDGSEPEIDGDSAETEILEDEDAGRPVPVLPPSTLLEGLSQLWSYPWEGLEWARTILKGMVSDDSLAKYRSTLASLEAALGAFDAAGEGIVGADAYQLEYTRLFIGSLKMYAPPYASYYMDGEQQVYGPTTVEIENLFAQFGIELDDNEHDMPDHLRFLLAFLAMLAKSYELKGENDFAFAYAGFKEDYITPWMGEFSAKINESAEFPFFKELLAFTFSVL